MKALVVESVSLLSSEEDPIREYNLRGAITEVEFEKDNFLKVMYDALKCDLIEAIDLPALGVTMWLDEEGKLKNNSHLNIDGSILYNKEYETEDVIVGHIAFTSIRQDEEGYTLGLNEPEEKIMRALLEVLQEKRPDKGFITEVIGG